MRVAAHAWPRIGAVVFVAAAILATGLSLQSGHAPARGDGSARPSAPPDPFAVQLRHCQALGEAGASDPGCLAAWAEARRRFLGVTTPSAQAPPP